MISCVLKVHQVDKPILAVSNFEVVPGSPPQLWCGPLSAMAFFFWAVSCNTAKLEGENSK